MPPGHAPAAEAGTELLQISPAQDLAAVEAAIATVDAFYGAHHTRIYIGSLLLAWAAFLLVTFAAQLRALLRAGDRTVPADLGFAGAIVFAVGLWLIAAATALFVWHVGS